MSSEQWQIGDISITKVEENQDVRTPLDFVVRVLADSSREEIEAIEWLRPTYLDDRGLSALVHSLLIETPTHKIVVDTGVGNHKTRLAAMFDDLDSDFLERFEQVWKREEVDGVISTHLHVDHVGWNTTLVGGEWVPTFPNAAYYFVREEFEHWKAFANDPLAPQAYTEWGYSLVDGVAVYHDSLEPIERADLIEFVEPGQTVVPGISLISTAGHTPGHVAVLIESGGDSAVITGDLLHMQPQIARPEWSPEMDTDKVAAAVTRRAFLERFADTSTVVLGTHFGTPTGNRVVRDGGSFSLIPVRG